MKKYLVGVILVLACCNTLVAAPPAIKALVIDSGSDFTHPVLKPVADPNLAELNGKSGVDDDKNGFADDIYGWNFVDNNNVLVDLSSTPPGYDRVLESLRLLNILQAQGKEALTPEEFKALVTAYNDPKFWPWVEFTGQWAHGTHCAGIMAEKNGRLAMKAVRHIPSGGTPQQLARNALAAIRHRLLHEAANDSRRTGAATSDAAGTPTINKVSMGQLAMMFSDLGRQYAGKARREAEYIGSLDARVINCSFGSDNGPLFAMFKENMIDNWGWTNPSDEEIQAVVNLFVMNALLVRDKALFGTSKNALFCIAAGNSSENIDLFMSSPVDVELDNKLIVAATMENKKLADFSCYGKRKVDVAVPGVNIYATYPNGKMGYMSGTSMACPMAARFATQVLQANESLTPVQVKKILMGTVDKKPWLTEKVRSGGVINPKRAVYAAELTKTGTQLDKAIGEACKKVADQVSRSTHRFKGPDLSDEMVRKLYFSGVF